MADHYEVLGVSKDKTFKLWALPYLQYAVSDRFALNLGGMRALSGKGDYQDAATAGSDRPKFDDEKRWPLLPRPGRWRCGRKSRRNVPDARTTRGM